MNRTFLGSIALTKLKHRVEKRKTKTGQEITGLFIPCELNHLVAGKDNAFYMPFRILLRPEPDQYDQNGFISQTVDPQTYKDATAEEREGFKALPILGNIKDFSRPDNDGELGDDYDAAEPPADDMPF